MLRLAAPRRLALLTVVPAIAACAASPALAAPGSGRDGNGGGGDRAEVRVGGTCGKGARSKLRLRSRDGTIRTDFEVRHTHAGSLWRVTIVHERQVAYSGFRRTAGRSRSFSLSHRVGDYSGADRVTARAVGPRGLVCVATATLHG